MGRWSLEAFDRAMREGVSRDGSHLFPVFPYYVFTGLSDDDVKALYAFLMTRPPLRATVPANTIPFPLSIRAFQEGWKILFFRSGRFKPDSSKSTEWNRGAYLAETLGDCGGCHTPRNSLGAEKVGDAYAGAVIDNWIAPPLTDANPSPVPWTQDELFNYLRTGLAPLQGTAIAATMTPVVRDGLGAPIVPEADVRALAVYFADIDHASVHETSVEPVVKSAIATSYLGSDQEYDPDARLYASACMSCHYNSGPAPLAARPELALMLPEPNNFIQAVLKGIGNADGAPGLVMPSYASSFSDAEVARLAAYLRRTRTKLPPWTDLEYKVAALRGIRRRRTDRNSSYATMTTFDLNGRSVSVRSPDDVPLLWVIHDELGLTGTKFGCGIGMCGACTVHVNGRATRSCITPVGAVAGTKVTTIEGLDPNGRHPLQTAWIGLQVPQCGYCQSGQIMQAATLLKDYPDPTDQDINAVMAGSLCRCMTYVRIRKAIKLAAARMRGGTVHG